MTRFLVNFFTYVMMLAITPLLNAQNYPKQPINLIIPLAPGDATDVAGRTIGEGMSKLLKVPVVAVNKTGRWRNDRHGQRDQIHQGWLHDSDHQQRVTGLQSRPDAGHRPFDPFKDLTRHRHGRAHADHPGGA